MKVLVACEESQRVCIAFRDKGHEYACQMWMGGTNHNTDARNCTNYETVKDSVSYFIGVQDGKKSNTNQYVIDRLHDLINSLEEEGEKEA